MILFCDTSALVKLYVAEAGSDLVRTAVEQAEAIAVSRIAWVEAHAAFARRVREESLDAAAIEDARAALSGDWPHYVVLEVDQALVELAAEYADTFALRAYDSMQLAAAFVTARLTEEDVRFACFDLRLNKAAKVLGMSGLG
jgi:predicted nucleic acid-binding protein